MVDPQAVHYRRQQLADFLVRCRARLTPESVGLNPGSRRRTPGLRREEVAQLASISVTWYTWLEQGREVQASPAVLASVAKALRLSDVETEYVFYLADQLAPPSADARAVTDVIQAVLDQLTPAPAYATSRSWDILAWNDAARQLLGDFESLSREERNVLYGVFIGYPGAPRLVNRSEHVRYWVGQFRAINSRSLATPDVQSLVDRMSELSPEFRELWASHEVNAPRHSRMQFIHAKAGLLSFEHLTLVATDDWPVEIQLYMPAPGTPTAEAFDELLTQDDRRADAVTTGRRSRSARGSKSGSPARSTESKSGQPTQRSTGQRT
jgi:transcriptional regulator with XRE-family HTH domain